jgi:hypothetical protein
MGEAAHPVALVVGILAVDVVGVDGGVVRVDVNQLLV